MKNLVIMFVKEPFLGKVKTRLAQKSSSEFALKFYKACVEDLLTTLHSFSFVLYSYPHVNFYANNDVYKQEGETLGQKMFHAFEEQFAQGYDNIVLIGSDAPQVTKEILNESFESLKTKKIVLGPSTDGGYYLIGMQKNTLKKELFENITWSTSSVFQQTLQKINNKELYLLQHLNDIDTVEDLKEFYLHYNNQHHLNSIKVIKECGYDKI